MSHQSEHSPQTIDDARARLESIYHLQTRVETLLLWVRDARPRDTGFALELCALAIPQLLKITDELLKAQIYFELGACRCDLGKWKEGAKELEMAYRSFYECGDTENAIRTARELGIQAERSGAFGDALRWFGRWRDRSEDAEDILSLAGALEHIAELQARQGEFDRALEYYFNSLALRERIGSRQKIGRALAAIGVIYGRTDNHASSAEFLDRALVIFSDVGDAAGEVEALGHRAHLRFLHGDLDGAREHWETALNIYRDINSKPGIGKTLAAIGNVHEKKGNKDLAFRHQLQALEHLQGADAFQHTIAALRNLGRLNVPYDQYDARFMLDHALMLAGKTGDLKLQYEVHYELYCVYKGRGDSFNALVHHEHYADIRQRLAGEEAQKRMAFNRVLFDVEQAERDHKKERERARNLEEEVRKSEKKLAEVGLDRSRIAELVRRAKREARHIEKRCGRGSTQGIEQTLRDLEHEISAESAWNVVEQQFGEDQREFKRRLRELTKPLTTPLTAAEERLCYLLRLNLQTKDAASVLCVGPRTVETHRLNIRRKLKPLFRESSMRLDAFLRGIQ